MDYYFILSKVMTTLLELMIGFLGTARFSPGWPVHNIKEFDDTQINFDELFSSVDSLATLLLNVMENALFFLFTKFHYVMDIRNALGGDQE